MIVLDAYALIALVGDEPPAAEVARLLDEDDCAMTAVNFAEVVDIACRVNRLALDELRDVLGKLTMSGRLRLVDLDEESAWRAGEFRLEYYAKKSSELSLADCFLLASAGAGDAIATADPPLAHAARVEGISIVPLPDASGRRP